MPKRIARSRRALLQSTIALTGSTLILRTALSNRDGDAFAEGHDDDGDSGNGRGRGRGRGGDGDQRDQENGDQNAGAPAVQLPPGAIEIRIVSDDAGGFVPGDVTVDLGQTVAFVNTHSDEHTATGSGFDTGIIQEGSVASVVLDTPGTFRYACQIHPEMTGVIAVRDASGNVPPPATPVASPVPGAASVRIANLSFDPPSITIPAGSTVTWSNDDITPHTVTATGGLFDSGIFDPGTSFSWTFAEPGTFAYQCLLHPSMQGNVVVEGEVPKANSPAPASNDTVTTAPSASSTSHSTSIWVIDLIPDDSSFLGPQRALIALHGDGLAQADFTATGAAATVETRLGDGHGTWSEADGHLALSLIALLSDADGRLAGSILIDASGQPTDAADPIAGIWSFAITDSSGTTVAEGQGVWQGSTTPLQP